MAVRLTALPELTPQFNPAPSNQPLVLMDAYVAIATFLGLWLFQNRCRTEWVIPLVALCLVSVLLVLPLGFLWNEDAVRHVSSSHFQPQLPKIDCKELQLMLDTDQVILVDARPAEMFQGDCIPGAINIPIGTSEINLQNALADLKKHHGKPVVTYCQNAHCGWAERIGGLISTRTTIPVVVFAEGLNGWHSNKGE